MHIVIDLFLLKFRFRYVMLTFILIYIFKMDSKRNDCFSLFLEKLSLGSIDIFLCLLIVKCSTFTTFFLLLESLHSGPPGGPWNRRFKPKCARAEQSLSITATAAPLSLPFTPPSRGFFKNLTRRIQLLDHFKHARTETRTRLFPRSQVGIVACWRAWRCQEAHAISQWSLCVSTPPPTNPPFTH